MKRFIITSVAIAVVGLTVAVSQQIMTQEQNLATFTYNAKVLKTGDLVFVRGTSWQSRIVLLTGISNQFSHLGLVWVHDNKISIIHATPNSYGKSDAEGVLIEPLQTFLSPSLITKVAASRYKKMTSKLANEIVTYARKYASQQIPFDFRFDFSSDDEIYCTEFIWLIYHKAGINLLKMKNIKGVLMPSQIRNSDHLAKLTDFEFENHNKIKTAKNN